MTSAEFVRRKNVISSAAPQTLTRALNTLGSLLDNAGATGSVTVTLPTDSQPGDLYDIDVIAAQAFVITAGAAGVFVLVGVAGTAGNSLRSSGTVGEGCQIVCTAANTWRVRNLVGTHFSVS
jgi:hypothetical protein